MWDSLVFYKQLNLHGYKIPSRKYSTGNVLPKIKENIDRKLVQLLKDVEFLSLTTDIWSTSLSNESLISMTAHWIGGEFKCTSAVLHAQNTYWGGYMSSFEINVGKLENF